MFMCLDSKPEDKKFCTKCQQAFPAVSPLVICGNTARSSETAVHGKRNNTRLKIMYSLLRGFREFTCFIGKSFIGIRVINCTLLILI